MARGLQQNLMKEIVSHSLFPDDEAEHTENQAATEFTDRIRSRLGCRQDPAFTRSQRAYFAAHTHTHNVRAAGTDRLNSVSVNSASAFLSEMKYRKTVKRLGHADAAVFVSSFSQKHSPQQYVSCAGT